jgi:hypothetical protein
LNFKVGKKATLISFRKELIHLNLLHVWFKWEMDSRSLNELCCNHIIAKKKYFYSYSAWWDNDEIEEKFLTMTNHRQKKIRYWLNIFRGWPLTFFIYGVQKFSQHKNFYGETFSGLCFQFQSHLKQCADMMKSSNGKLLWFISFAMKIAIQTQCTQTRVIFSHILGFFLPLYEAHASPRGYTERV